MPSPITAPRHELRAEKAAWNKESALGAFIGKKAEIDEMLARLQALSDDHFNCHPDEVGWAMVGKVPRSGGCRWLPDSGCRAGLQAGSSGHQRCPVGRPAFIGV